MILRPYQSRLVSRAVQALERHGNTLAVGATGAGKTLMLSALAGELGGKALILQHRQELVQQNMRKFKLMNPKARCSLFTADDKSFAGDATFAMVQSLTGHADEMPPFDLVIADEAHHVAAPTWMRILDQARRLNPKVKIAGFTATPSRSDRRGLRKVFSNVCDQVTVGELVSLGFLVPPRAFIVDVDGAGEALAGLGQQSDFGEQSQVEEILDTEVVNAEVVRHWRDKADGRPTVVFASTVVHAQDVARAFREAGIPAECVHGDLSAGERQGILMRVAQGRTKIVTNCMVLTEGWDFPPISCVILLRRCSDKGPLIQMAGRGLRTVDPREFPGVVKKDCIIMDFGSSLAQHGDIQAVVDLGSEGDGETGEKGAPELKECPECGAEMPQNTRTCPFCGHQFGGDGPAKVTHVELSEVDILGKSPWRYVDLFGTGRCFLASGFEAWAGIFSRDDETWHAVGRRRMHRVEPVMVGGRVQALAAADDYLRTYETEGASKKNRRWLDDPATDAQMAQLARYGYDPGLYLSKYAAGAHLSFQFGRQAIERIIGVA